MTENTPQGVQTGGAGAENTVAPKQEENVVRPEGPANVRVTPVQQNQFGEATPETLKANTEHFTRAFAGPRSAINPVEMSYLSAKEPSGKAGNQVQREQQRVAADRLEKASKDAGLPNPLREKYQKVSVPYGFAGDESRIHAMSLDKVVHNVDLLQGFLHLNPEAAKVVDPQYLASPQLTRDLQTYLSNQSHGYSGAGEELVRPADTRENTVTPQDDNYTPVKLDPKKAQIINMLMGMEQPDKMTPGQAYSTRFAQQNGIETVPVKTGKGDIVQDTNPVRAALRTEHGFDPKVLNAAVEVLNTKRITAPVKERPDLNFKAGDTAFQRAGFMPEVKRPQGNDETRRVAAEYAEKNGINTAPHAGNAPVNEELAKRIADFYHEAKSEPNAPAVKNAYQALADETMSQYGAMKEAGIKIEPWDGKGEPYKNSAEMQADVRDNKHLWFFKTDNGFGDGAPQENALLQPSGVKINGHELLVNDVFRAVHDYFGHTAEGYEFGPRGEYNAYLAHSKMFSDEAKPALAAETLAQNSWVNFGPHLRREDGSIPQRGDADFVPLPKRPFAEQKNVAVPKELIDEAEKNGASFMPQLRGPKLEHAVPEDELSLVHYGDQGLKSIDTSHFGKSGITPRSELSGAPRSYWYEEGQENKHDPVLGRGAKYAATVSGARIYDGDADPLNYGGIINREKADDMLKDAGYAGIRRTGGRGRNSYSQVELFEPVKPTRLAPEKQAASFMPRMANLTDDQRSALDDAVRSFGGRKPTPDEVDAVARKLRAIPTETPVEQRTVPGKELANATLPKGTGAFPLNDEADGHRTGNAAEIAWRGLVNTWGKRNASFMPENEEKEPFYSPLERTLRNIPDKANRQQIEAALRGTKAEEMRDVKDPAGQSFEDYLKNNPQATKQDMLDFASQHRVEVNEHVLGMDGFSQKDKERLDFLERQSRRGHTTYEEDEEYQALIDKENAASEPGDTPEVTKYEDYQLPGGANYRETIFTLPPHEAVPHNPRFMELLRKKNEQGAASLSESERKEYINLKSEADARPLHASYRSSHFSDVPDYLAHARTNERAAYGTNSLTSIEGKLMEAVGAKKASSLASGAPEVGVSKGAISEQEAKQISFANGWRNKFNPKGETGDVLNVLHAEEIQSDLHQEGRKKGYSKSAAEKAELQAKLDATDKEIEQNGKAVDLSRAAVDIRTPEMVKAVAMREAAEGRHGELLRQRATLMNSLADNSVPDAPFKKTWHELVFKQLLRKAAESGKDYLSWTTGEQQAERYNLSKQIDNVYARKRADGTYSISVTEKGKSGLTGIAGEAKEMAS